MYLLGLSNLVPTNKFLKRLAKINYQKWDCSKDDPYVKEYLDQESETEYYGSVAGLQNQTHIEDHFIEEDSKNQVLSNNDGSIALSKVDTSNS